MSAASVFGPRCRAATSRTLAACPDLPVPGPFHWFASFLDNNDANMEVQLQNSTHQHYQLGESIRDPPTPNHQSRSFRVELQSSFISTHFNGVVGAKWKWKSKMPNQCPLFCCSKVHYAPLSVAQEHAAHVGPHKSSIFLMMAPWHCWPAASLRLSCLQTLKSNTDAATCVTSVNTCPN